MLEIITIIALLLLGVAFYFFRKPKSTSNGLSVMVPEPSKLEEPSSPLKSPTKKSIKASNNLEGVVLPGNFPNEMIFYYGS